MNMKQTEFRLIDAEDKSYLIGVFGEGWTYKKREACVFSSMGASFYKWWLKVSQNLDLEIV